MQHNMTDLGEEFESSSSSDVVTPLRTHDQDESWFLLDTNTCTASTDSGIEYSGNNNDNGLREKAIVSLRERMPLRTELNFEDCDDQFLLRFLRARDFNIDAAFGTLCSYYEFRRDNPKLSLGLNALELRYILEDGFPCVLPNQSAGGQTFMVLFPGNWDTETFSVDVLLQALMLSIENLSESVTVQTKGIVLLVDFSGWTTSHASYLSISYIKKFITIFQDCFPVVFRSVHIINQPWYINALVSLMKPFLRGKIDDKVFLHGNNLTTLHKYISQDTLPAEFGGDRSEVDQGYWAGVLLEAKKQAERKDSVVRIGKNPLRYSVGVAAAPNMNEIEEAQSLLLQE